MTSTAPVPFTLQSLRDLYASYPAERWAVNYRHAEDGRHCAIGIIEHATDDIHVGESHPVFQLFKPLVTHRTLGGRGDWALADVNNGHDDRYPQDNPRARVLAAMDDLIAGNVPAA